MRKDILMIGVLLFLVTGSVFAWDKKDGDEFVQPGRRISRSLILSEDQISYSYITFKVRVPDNIFKMEVKIDNSPADLDIFVNFNRDIENYDDVDYSSTEDLFNESVSVSRMSSLPLETGIYYIDIVYPLDVLPIIYDREATAIPFGFTARLTPIDPPVILRPDVPVEATLPSRGNQAKIFAVDIDESVEALRIDLFNTKTDLDMYMSYGKPAYLFEEADFIRESYLGQESLVLSRYSEKPLVTGQYFITVFDRIEDNLSDSFSIIATHSKKVPDFLTQYPPLPIGGNALENALFSTVEISTETGSGSACLISEEGHLITGLHVITDLSGNVSDKIFISMNLSNYFPPTELFIAELIDIRKDEDLAFLKIKSGLYGQDLPLNYKFPHFKLAFNKEVTMGQNLSFLGYPQIGSESSKASISLTRGIVSGFDTMDFGYLIKTDGEINSGNSGGAAFNESYDLIGFPMSVISDEGGQLAFIHPISLIPESWIQIAGLQK